MVSENHPANSSLAFARVYRWELVIILNNPKELKKKLINLFQLFGNVSYSLYTTNNNNNNTSQARMEPEMDIFPEKKKKKKVEKVGKLLCLG